MNDRDEGLNEPQKIWGTSHMDLSPIIIPPLPTPASNSKPLFYMPFRILELFFTRFERADIGPSLK